MQKNGWIINCKKCGRGRYITPSLFQRGRGVYCSASCRSKDAVYEMLKVRGESWRNKAKISMVKLQLSYRDDETKHPRWKGDEVGYFGVHDWITKHYGQPKKCEICGLSDSNRKYHWANLDSKYRRNISDWKRMCVSCHRKYDYSRKNR